jgi:putative transcriptional regulator
MSSLEYILHRQYFPHMVNTAIDKGIMLEIRLDKLLERQRRTFYWLAKETGISHTTLWRLKKGKALGINFETLEKLCQALECQPGHLFLLKTNNTGRKQGKKKR